MGLNSSSSFRCYHLPDYLPCLKMDATRQIPKRSQALRQNNKAGWNSIMSIVFTYWSTQKLSVRVNGLPAQTKLEYYTKMRN